VYGDGNRAVEFNTDFGPSVIDNGSMRIKQELIDQDIVDHFAPQIAEEVVPLPTEIIEDIEVTEKPKGVKVKEGIYVNQEALTKEEQLELFDYLKPFLEEQAARTLKGDKASKMIGLGLRWDYKSNNSGKQAMNIPDVINPGNKTKYGYYDTSINNQALGAITPRFRELMQKATGVDMTNYDGAIINLYEPTTFISSHNDVDESRSAIGYPVIGINIGGTGNFSIESRDGAPKQLNLNAGAGYVFGVDGVNREVYHRTFAKPQDSFLPELNTKIDGKVYEPGSYRVTVTMRRVMPLEPGMPAKPTITSTETVSKPEQQLSLFNLMFGDTLTLKDGKEYNKSEVNSGMLEAMGYTPKEIGRILKSIC
jgi:alkylated DNA repair dioxygenase AlkB